METTTQIPKEVEISIKESEAMLLNCEKIEITNNDQYQRAGEYLKSVKTKSKEIEKIRTSITQPINASLSAINSFFKKPQEILQKAEIKIKKSILDFQEKEERKRKVEEARLAEIARREEEKERKRLEQIAERAVNSGKIEKAEEILDIAESLHIPQQVAMPTFEAIKGVSTPTNWKWKLINIEDVPRKYLKLDETKITKMVIAIKDDFDIPGIKIYSEKTIASRSN